MSADVLLDAAEVVSCRLARPLQGTWTLEAELSADLAPKPGPCSLAFAREGDTPAIFRGTIIHTGEREGRAQVFAVGGAGGLRGGGQGQDYGEILPRLVAEDILTDWGEVAGDLSGLDGAPKLERWTRAAGSGAAALTQLCERVTAIVGEPVHWRVRPDGAVDVVRETWRAFDVALSEILVEPNALGRGVLGLDGPDLPPGVSVIGQRVSSVVYELAEEGSAFRVHYLVDLPSGGRGREAELLRKLVERAQAPRAFSLRHRATIVDQDADGRVGVRLDDDDAPVLTLAAVPVYFGLPGVTFTASAGAQVLVEFLGGDERRPAVTGFLAGCSFGAVNLSSGGPATRGAARLGDTGSAGTLLLGSDFAHFPLVLLMAYLPPGVPIPPAASVPPFLPTGVPIVSPIPAPIPFPMSMRIDTASSEVKLK